MQSLTSEGDVLLSQSRTKRNLLNERRPELVCVDRVLCSHVDSHRQVSRLLSEHLPFVDVSSLQQQ